jgi:hypothetical protein
LRRSTLAHGDAPKAHDAIRALALSPKQSVPLLRDRLRPGSADSQCLKGGTSMTSRIHILCSLPVLALICNLSSGQPEQPAPDAVAKLIGQLSSKDFQTRQGASAKLEKLGAPVLPALRKALKTDVELEARRRIEQVIGRIEAGLLQAEEKLWKGLDAQQRGVKDRLIKILARTPTLSDRQVAAAIYLITVGRSPTEPELKDAQKQLAEGSIRWASILRLARSLVQGKEFNTALAGVNERLIKARKELATENEIAKALIRLNSAEFQKLIDEVAAATAKATKTDEDFVDLAFLLTVSRFPGEEQQRKPALGHLKRAPNRTTAASNVFWALLSTKEFLVTR